MTRFVTTISLHALLLLSGCAGTATTSAPPTTPSTGRTSILDEREEPACALLSVDVEGEPAFVVLGPGDYGVLVPGTKEAWNARCPTDDPREPFFGELVGEENAFGLSLEIVGFDSEPDEPFDEAGYLALQAALQVEQHGGEDRGAATLENGHAAHFVAFSRRFDDGSVAHSVHGYAARRLDGDHVLLLHTSLTSSREPATDDLLALLSLFGKVDELVQSE